MGRPLLVDAWERPATTSIVCVCCVVWWYLNSKGLGYEEVGVSYKKAVKERQLWRCVTASFSHVSLMHLLFNMSSLWSLGVVEQMGGKGAGWGTDWYLRYTLVMIVGTMALVLAITHVLVKFCKLERYENVTSVGYSCVVFGWMTVVSVKGTSSTISLFGFVNVPINLAPFGSLIFTSLIVPQASFIGHLAGIAVGYLVAWDAFAWLTFYWTAALLFGVVAVFVGTLELTTDLDIPSLRIFGTGSETGSGDKKFGGVGRRLGGEPVAGSSRLLATESTV
jgi:membrane associated rhomboid family serine protease